MNLARKNIIAQIITVAFVTAAFFLQRGLLVAVLPLLALAACMYLVWMVQRARRSAERQAMQASSGVPADRGLLKLPDISGEVVAPAETSTIDPAEMESYLSSRIIGQGLVGSQIARGIYRRMAQERRGKPIFTALLSGPTGTGKTELAKAIASFLWGSQALFRVDCANIIGEAGLQTLIGSPKGYAGSSSWGALTAHLRSNPRSVLLFDELEKAVTSPNAPMAKLLLSLLDEGICTEQSDGSIVSAQDAVVLMTSNAAQDRLGAVFERYQGEPDELTRATKDALRDHFSAEFLARINLVTTLSPLDTQARARIVALHTARIGANYGIEISEIDASFVNEAIRLWATLEGYGTREVIRWVEQTIADRLIEVKKTDTRRVRVAWSRDNIVIEEYEHVG